MSIIQDGKDVADADGVFRLARRPFTVRYRGAEHPGLAVSPTTELIDALHRRARRELWGSAGDFIALSPNDLPLTKEFEIFVDDKSRSEFAEVLGGEEYVELLRHLVVDYPRLDTAAHIPKASGFEPLESGDGYALEVRTIDHEPVGQTRFSRLYVAYFGTMDRLGPARESEYRHRILLRMNWGACVVAFEE
ncbi:hypothetical protein OV090_41720 [Nannocystis sp. RBIL2]|uniref:hypothetical protein n=1 Tax=Nannocystis sp. RBIL2 TaxID=2996788 RepID=UPI00227056F0|nr:hypothetical protein [Nannocystis sp. RBIL2]MCY1071335.1 hypothetical protein [Nannocystis sp. RBIL2]